MKRLIFDAEHELFRDSVARFVEREVTPHAERWRQQGIVDREAYTRAGAAGLLCLWGDTVFGGSIYASIRSSSKRIFVPVRPGFTCISIVTSWHPISINSGRNRSAPG